MFKKVLLAAAVTAAFATGAQAAVGVSSTGGTLKATIGDNGTFEVGSPMLEWMGTEFVNWGTPASWFSFYDGVTQYTSYSVDGSKAFAGSMTYAAGSAAATTFTGGTWAFSQVTSAANEDKLTVTLNITNNSKFAVAGGQFNVGFDPDHGMPSTFSTRNYDVTSGGAAGVSAEAGGKIVRLQNDTSASAFSIYGYVNAGNCCGPLGLPAPAFSGAGSIGDDSINLVYDLGTIAAGQTVSIGYSYNFAPVPEPETYALMLAGLGLVGFMAKRRKIG